MAELAAAIRRMVETLPLASPAVSQEVVDARGVGLMLGATVKTVRKMDCRGELPEPLVIGSRRKWRVAELRAWLAAGAPGREKWRAMRPR